MLLLFTILGVDIAKTILLVINPASFLQFGRSASGRFRNGYFEYFELQCEERRTFFRGLAGRLFLSEGSSLFPPFLFLSGGILGTFHRFSKYPFAKYPVANF